jgi:uncharacterized protein (DUF1697 family)
MDVIRYLGLLRGINVGGSNIIKMADLRSCFEEMGFKGVLTYIQSGNVLFESEDRDKLKLQDKIEKVLSDRFNYSSSVVVVTHQQLTVIVDKAPSGFGEEADKYRYDVLFVKEPLTPDEIMKELRIKEGVDRAYNGESVLYFSRLIIRASQSHLTRIITLPVYKYITIRNWNTTTRLLSLMGE